MTVTFPAKENSHRQPSTSALGAMRHLPHSCLIGPRTPMAFCRTQSSGTGAGQGLLAVRKITDSGITVPSASSPELTQKALRELRRLSGLTWDQLARLFNVSRRSLHFWASGQPLSRSNEEQLNRLLGAMRYVNRGSASLNRNLLFRPDAHGSPPFDLLVAGKYEEFKRIVGSNNAPRRPLLGDLTEDERKRYYSPQNPADLVDALQEPIHRNVGKSRPARTARSRKNSSGQ